MTRQHRVAEIVSVALPQHSGREMESRRTLEIAQERRMLLLGRDFLQRDDVGADFPEHVDDPCGDVAAIGADSAVDVPGRDFQRLRAWRVTRMSRFRPPSSFVWRIVTTRSRKPGAARCRLSRQFCIVRTIVDANENIAANPRSAIT